MKACSIGQQTTAKQFGNNLQRCNKLDCCPMDQASNQSILSCDYVASVCAERSFVASQVDRTRLAIVNKSEIATHAYKVQHHMKMSMHIYFNIETYQCICNINSHRMRKPTICICENKAAIQPCSNCTADQGLCFRSIVQYPFFLNPKFQASSLFLSLYRPVCVGPGREPKLLGFLIHRLNFEQLA